MSPQDALVLTQRQSARRLVLAITLPVVLLLGAGSLLALQLSKMNASSRWLEHSDEVLNALQSLQLMQSRQESALRGFQLRPMSAFLEDFAAADPHDQAASLRALVADNPQQQARLDDFILRYESWRALAAEVLRARSPDIGGIDERRRIAQEMLQLLGGFRGVELGLREARAKHLSDSTRATNWVLAGLLGLTALALGAFSRNSLVTVHRAFSSALSGEKAARERVQREEWLAAGALALAEAVAGDIRVEEVGQRALVVFSSRARAVLGALFLRSGGRFERAATLGMDSRAAGPDRFEDGHGLLGQAAVSPAVSVLTSLPDDFVKIRTGLGECCPRAVALVPIRHEGQVLALVELGYLTDPTPLELALLSRMSEGLGAAVHAAQQRERLHALLEESQRQGEELQAQQEELRLANDELLAQSGALETIQAELRERQHALSNINHDLTEKADALEQARAELQQRAGELERVNRYKSDFLANMSHELRTPLNSSLILAKLLAENREGNLTAEQRKFASTIYAAGNDLLALINDVLDLSKIEAGRLDVDVSVTPLGPMLEAMQNAFAPIAKQRGLELSCALQPSAPDTIESDPLRLQQILKNLLSNALKFTERGRVELDVRTEGDDVAFAVRDTGIGIADHQRELVFDAFHQVDGTMNRRYGGTGLGLSISRDLARLLGGRIELVSAPGQGSTFTLLLPRRFSGPSAAPSERPPAPTAPERNAAPTSEAHGLGIADDRARLDRSRPLLLVVEDDAPFAELLLSVAHEIEFQCVVAMTAAEALDLAVSLQPAAIVLDMKLPDRSGLSVLERLKASARTRSIPVHVVSSADYATQALAMGAVGYLHKPIEHDQLVSLLRGLESQLVKRMSRVLVVEDDVTQREALVQLLQAPGIEVDAVDNVPEALARLEKVSFDCVITDLALPGLSGFDLLERMAEAQFSQPRPPVIVYTGRSLSEEEEQRLRRQSSTVIVKGGRSPERLLDEVTLFLHRVESDLPSERQRATSAARDRERSLEQRTILVAEDDVRNVFALTSVLEPRGARVHIARTGKQALSQLERYPEVDLVLMDIMMPEMDGLQAIREIRRESRWSNLPIIALTAKAMRDDYERCLAAGANDYMSKPLDVEALLSLLRVWLPK